MKLESCPKCGGNEIIGVQYAYDCKYHYDGVSEWMCAHCNYREGRFCGKELKGNECEPSFCENRKGHPLVIRLDNETERQSEEGEGIQIPGNSSFNGSQS